MDIRPISATQTYTIRHQVLRPHQPLDLCRYPGDEATPTLHLGAFRKEMLLGIASFYNEPHPDVRAARPFRLRGMATLPSERGRGYGAALIREGIRLLQKTQGTDVIWCNAREVALRFYERLGFQTQGGLFEIEGIGPHFVMTLRLETTP